MTPFTVGARSKLKTTHESGENLFLFFRLVIALNQTRTALDTRTQRNHLKFFFFFLKVYLYQSELVISVLVQRNWILLQRFVFFVFRPENHKQHSIWNL